MRNESNILKKLINLLTARLHPAFGTAIAVEIGTTTIICSPECIKEYRNKEDI